MQLEYCEIDYQRRIVGNSKIGIEQASKWAASDDRYRRILRLVLINEIALKDSASAVQMLRSLSASRNPDVSGEAKQFLEALPRWLSAHKSRVGK
jgi:hypothetical protein